MELIEDNARNEQNKVAAPSVEGTPNNSVTSNVDDVQKDPSSTPLTNALTDQSTSEVKKELKRKAIVTAEAASPEHIDPEEYSEVQEDRFSVLTGFYPYKDAQRIVDLLSIHGESAYSRVKEKVDAIDSGNSIHSEKVQNELEAVLVINKVVTKSQITQHGTKVRRANKLMPYAKDAHKNCLNDILSRYIYEVVKIDYYQNGKEKSEVIGYVPRFNLNCQSPS